MACLQNWSQNTLGSIPFLMFKHSSRKTVGITLKLYANLLDLTAFQSWVPLFMNLVFLSIYSDLFFSVFHNVTEVLVYSKLYLCKAYKNMRFKHKYICKSMKPSSHPKQRTFSSSPKYSSSHFVKHLSLQIHLQANMDLCSSSID